MLARFFRSQRRNGHILRLLPGPYPRLKASHRRRLDDNLRVFNRATLAVASQRISSGATASPCITAWPPSPVGVVPVSSDN